MPKTKTTSLGIQLRCAASQGDIDKVKEFLDPNIINLPSSNGNTALHWSIIKKHYLVTKHLLTVSKIDVDIQNAQGHTPLHIATLLGDKKTVYRLIRAGAGQKNIIDNDGFSPLDYACKKSYSFIFTLLKNTFPNWTFKDENKLAEEIYEKFKKNNPSLINDSHIFDPNYLFDSNVASYFKPINRKTLTDFKHAIEKKILDPHKFFVCGNLLQSAANSRVDTLNKFRWLLLEKNVNPNIQGSLELNPSSYKNTALHTLIANESEKESLELIELLISSNRFNFNLTDSEGKTCLCLAVKVGLSAVAKKLISLKDKVDINISDEEGNTPLHYALLLGHLSIVEELIKNQCHNNVKNKENKTPYELLISSNEEDVRDCLETIWINPDRKVKTAQTTYLGWCMQNRKTITEEYLTKKRNITFLLAAQTGELSKRQEVDDAHTLNTAHLKDNTVLDLSSAYDHKEAVKFLLQQPRIDLDKKNQDNKKAVDLVSTPALSTLFKTKCSISTKGHSKKESLNQVDQESDLAVTKLN